MTPEETAICAAVAHHVQTKTPLEKYGDFWEAVAGTLQEQHGITISHNTVQRQYEKHWQIWGGVDSRKYCQKAVKKHFEDNPQLKKAAYPDSSDAVAKMHEPMEKQAAREGDAFAQDMGASLEAAKDDQTASFQDTLSIRPAQRKPGQQEQDQN